MAKAIADKAAVQLTYLMESPCLRGVGKQPGNAARASVLKMVSHQLHICIYIYIYTHMAKGRICFRVFFVAILDCPEI